MRNIAWHYYQKIANIGFFRAGQVGVKRAYKRLFFYLLSRGWYTVGARCQGAAWESFIDRMSTHNLFYLQKPLHEVSPALYASANRWVAYALKLQSFDCAAPWYTDTRLGTFNVFDRRSWYVAIAIRQHNGFDGGPDIKVPWDLARFQFLPILATAYMGTRDIKYRQALIWFLNDWWRQAPFGRGIHWMNPMEVSLRAINWIVAFEIIKDDLSRDEKNKWAVSLYEHQEYLTYNEEFYDGRTNNHYLSNLVGLIYLNWFFNSFNTRDNRWCIVQLIREIDWQILDDGSSYEGSTAYHQLVTALITHGVLMARESGYAIPDITIKKITSMYLFSAMCTPLHHTVPVMIGDDDSGMVLHPLMRDLIVPFARSLFPALSGDTPPLYFPHFGLSVYKSNKWHITLRHEAYTMRQPSAHFHYDWASITLFYKGVPIIIDPGTYVYTASAAWRNFFRRADMHSGWYVGDVEVPSHDLFSLDMPQRTFKPDAYMYATRQFNQGIGHRRVITNDEGITITDWYEGNDADGMIATWQFIFHPAITLEQRQGDWFVLHNHRPLMRIVSDVPLQVREAWYAPQYGVKVASLALRGRLIGASGRVVTTKYYVLC